MKIQIDKKSGILKLSNYQSVSTIESFESFERHFLSNLFIYWPHYVMFEKGPGAYFVSIRSIFNKPVAFTNVADVTFVEEQAWENKYDVQTKQSWRRTV